MENEKLTIGNIKSLFFQDIFIELEKFGFDNDWFVYPGGGNVKKKDSNVLIAIFCDEFEITARHCLWNYGDFNVLTIKHFNLMNPSCYDDIVGWAKEIS